MRDEKNDLEKKQAGIRFRNASLWRRDQSGLRGQLGSSARMDCNGGTVDSA